MNDLNLEKYLNLVNEEKRKKGLENYTPLYPMLRVEITNNKKFLNILWKKRFNIKTT